MSNRGAGRGPTNPNAKYKAGNKPGNSNKRRSPQNEQKYEEGGARQASSSENQEASGAQQSGSDNKLNKSGYKNNFENRQRNQGPGFFVRGDKPRAFNMSPNSNSDVEFDQKSTSSDDFKERTKGRMSSLHSAKATLEKGDRNANNSDKSSISPFISTAHSVKTESGPFECTNNFPDPNEPCQSGSNNAEELDIKKEESCVTEVEGDLFSAPENVSLAHCVGADLRMGSGVAVHFRDKFKSIGKLFDQHVGPGGVATIPSGQRHVFYLITKQASSDKPTNDTMRQSLLALHQKCKELNVTQLAMPQIGCGLDGLSWVDIKQMLEEIFADGFTITVYKLDKDFVATPKPGFKSRVVNNNLLLKNIEQGTGLLYIGYADSFVSPEMKSIDDKYRFLSRLNNSSCKLGRTFHTKSIQGEMVYGLFCKKSKDSRLSYEHLEAAIDHLKRHNERHKYEYFGIQAFEEKNDPHVMEKIDTLFRNSLIDAEFWICWPRHLEHKRPSNLEQNEDVVQVQGNQHRQSTASHPSNSADKFEGLKDNNDSPKVDNKWDNTRKNSQGQDQGVREVEEKMNAQSLGDESKSGFNHSEAKNEDPNTSEMNWDDDDKQFAEIPDPVDSSHTTDDGEWLGVDQHAEDERRKSSEKKKAKELSKEKERQERRSVKPKSCVTECKGDLFDAEDTMCLAHCVGADFRMGSGIAVLFRQQFGHIPELLDQGVTQGGVAYIKHKERYIFYLVTKRESTGKPTYGTLEGSLLELHKICKELNVSEIAMPRIGCGLDRLEWSEVKEMLENIFADGFSIKIYNLEKDYKETKQSMPKTTIKNEILHLKDIERGTGLLYIGTVEPFVSEEMKSLDEKYPFLQRLDKARPTLGTVVRTEAASYPREIVTGLICKQSPKDRLSFVHLQAALKQLKKSAKTVKYYGYYGIQAFKDSHDDNIMGKIETLFRYSYIEAEVWICFPPSLKHLMSPSSLPTFSPSNSGNGRTLWVEADNKRMAAMLRDYQRTQEAMYRRLTDLDDLKDEISGPDGLKEKTNQIITTEINEIRNGMEELSSKVDSIIQDYQSFYQCYQILQDKVASRETSDQLLEKRVQLLEQQLQAPHRSIPQAYGLNMNGSYSSSNIPDGPLPLVQSSVGAPVWPSPADYYTGNLQIVHPNYYPHPQFYASDQLPEERQALMRAVQHSAKKNGYEFKSDENGMIYVRKNDHHRFSRISSYGDLNSFENSRV